jgi:hypothetical protein
MKNKEDDNLNGKHCHKGHLHGHGGNGAVYGLGFVGAAVYFIGPVTSFGAGVIGFLKALVWPAFLVYEAFKFLGR